LLLIFLSFLRSSLKNKNLKLSDLSPKSKTIHKANMPFTSLSGPERAAAISIPFNPMFHILRGVFLRDTPVLSEVEGQCDIRTKFLPFYFPVPRLP